MKKSKQALFQSVISLLLCFSMLVGTTFAWFTDGVSSGNNLIAAGNLDVDLEYMDKNGQWQKVTEATEVLDKDALWEPGHTEVAYLRISNAGELALKYALGINIVSEIGSTNAAGEAFKLSDHIRFGVVESESETTYADRMAARNALSETKLINAGYTSQYSLYPETGRDVRYATLVVYMPEDVGNVANYATGANPPEIQLGIELVATQEVLESDSFGSDYDTNAEMPGFSFPENVFGENASTGVSKDNENKTSESVTIQGATTNAVIPVGVQLEENVDKLTLEVTSMTESQANITLGENDAVRSLNVHVEGVSKDNTMPMEITIKEAAAKGLNSTSIKLYHVENGVTVEMTAVDTFTAHNQFKYDPATGDITLYMATFSEVACVVDTLNPWTGGVDYDWYTDKSAPYYIANAEQLAAFGAIVGGMDGQTRDSFEGKTVKLISNINLGDKDNANENLIFHPIGYSYVNGDSTVKSFEGIFDGQGHIIANFYQNTWEIKGDYDGTYYKDAMGLFGYVVNGTVKNLTVDHFSSDGEFTPTGVIAAYAVNSTFENIAITNCNPRVYNTGNGGIIGIAGKTNGNGQITLKNITVDNSNKITALWGSWDVACGGLVGMFRGNADGGSEKIHFENCHVAAQIDVYNDVCANYQYYAYRYAGMMIGSVRHNTTDNDGKTIPNMTGISASGCTVNYGDWNDYYYCEFVKNSLASYTHDHQFSRVSKDEIIFDENGNIVGCKHNHKDYNGDGVEDTEVINGETVYVEDKTAVYLPFHQLFTGYSWGVTSVGLEEFGGIYIEGVSKGDQENSVVKFNAKFPNAKVDEKTGVVTTNFLYRVGNANTVNVGSLFAVLSAYAEGSEHQLEVKKTTNVHVTIDKVDEKSNVSGTFTANTSDWTKGTIQFSGTGKVKVTIQDYNFCTPTILELEVVDAVNATSATSATSTNVVLLNDIGSGFTVSGRYTVYGNGFTLNYTGNGQYLNNGLKQGIVSVTQNGKLDNLRIVASIYPESYLYYAEVQKGDKTVDGDKTRYHYQLSAVAASGNATISNCYIYGSRNNVYVGNGNVTIKDTILENGTLSNVQIQSTSDYTVTFQNVTTIQTMTKSNVGTIGKNMLGAGIIVGPETDSNPKIVLNGSFKQYNWVTYADGDNVSNSTARTIISTALGVDDFVHTINNKDSANLGIIYLNESDANVVNNTTQPYVKETVSITALNVTGQVYSLKNANSDQIFSETENVDKNTVNGVYEPQFKYSSDLGGQYIAKTDDGDEFCYREGDTIKVMFPSGDTKTLDLAALVNIEKYSGQDLDIKITCKDSQGNNVELTGNKITLATIETYTVTYSVKDEYGTYSWNVTLDVSLKDTKLPDARFDFDEDKQIMGYSANSNAVQYIPFLAGLKIYDYNGKTEYLRFDGDDLEDGYKKVAKVTLTASPTESNHYLVTVNLTDGGVITLHMLARADSGGSTYSGSIKTNDNKIYYVNGGKTSATTTTWTIDYYKFTGNNGVEINSGKIVFEKCSKASAPSGSFSTTIKYTVTYDANGGNCVQTLGYATSAATAVTLPAPARSGYIFAGWYTAASGGTRVGGAGEEYTPSANITLYAQWGKPCTVTFNANGGSCDMSSFYYDGTKKLLLPAATNGNKVLKGWYTATSGGTRVGAANEEYNPSAEITLYAQWQDPATVTYNANDGTCDIVSATFNGTELTLPTPTRTGYKFLGWYTDASSGTKFGDAGKTFIPSESVTYYAQWERISYTITINKQTYATVTVDKTSAYYGDTISVTVTFSKSNSKSLTVKDASGNTILSKSAAGTYTFTMPASNVTVEASSSSSCVTGDTLVTLADGTQKRIDQVTYADQLRVWNFYTGEYAVAPSALIQNHGYAWNNIIKLTFSDGTVTKAINEHGYFDATINEFVMITADNAADYIGHEFVKENSDSYTTVTLVSAEVSEEYVEAYSILSAYYYNFITDRMFSLTSPVIETNFFMPFVVGENMTFDAEKMAEDIEKYGLYEYADFEGKIPYEVFEALNIKYLKVAVGKGLVTYDQIVELLLSEGVI